MEVDQMLHHLNLACGGSQGFYDLPDESYLISRTLFKWILVDWYPQQPLACGSRQASKFHHAQRFEFADEKAQLLKILEADWNAKTADQWKPHPNVRHNVAHAVGQASADPSRLPPEAIFSMTKMSCCRLLEHSKYRRPNFQRMTYDKRAYPTRAGRYIQPDF